MNHVVDDLLHVILSKMYMETFCVIRLHMKCYKQLLTSERIRLFSEARDFSFCARNNNFNVKVQQLLKAERTRFDVLSLVCKQFNVCTSKLRISYIASELQIVKQLSEILQIYHQSIKTYFVHAVQQMNP